jgi:hypothetical protein
VSQAHCSASITNRPAQSACGNFDHRDEALELADRVIGNGSDGRKIFPLQKEGKKYFVEDWILSIISIAGVGREKST